MITLKAASARTFPLWCIKSGVSNGPIEKRFNFPCDGIIISVRLLFWCYACAPNPKTKHNLTEWPWAQFTARTWKLRLVRLRLIGAAGSTQHTGRLITQHTACVWWRTCGVFGWTRTFMPYVFLVPSWSLIKVNRSTATDRKRTAPFEATRITLSFGESHAS